jgi:hypothetical protein
MRQLATLLLATLPFAAVGQDDSAVLEWQHDGLNLASFRIYYGRSPTALTGMRAVLDPAARTAAVDGLSDGAWYFAMTAVGPTASESALSNIACAVVPSGTCAPSVEPPGPVRNLVVTVVPRAAVTVRVEQDDDMLNIVATGTAPVRLQLQPVGAVLDWFKVAGQNSADIPGVSPALGSNNDGRSSNVITFTAPVNGWADYDGSTLTGITATVNGINKPLLRSGTTWSASF